MRRLPEEIEVGGELTDERLVAIRERALWLRNSYDMGPASDGETPRLVYVDGDGGETRFDEIELHIGCDCEGCYVLATFPHRAEDGGPDRYAAEAVCHAGRDMLDLVAEVRRLRALAAVTNEVAKLAAERGGK